MVESRREIVRLILANIRFGDTANSLSMRYRIPFSKNDLLALRDFDMFSISDNRLWNWAEAMGITIRVQVGNDPPPSTAVSMTAMSAPLPRRGREPDPDQFPLLA